MQKKIPSITRRTLVAGAAAGTLALAADPASAQRCPPAAARTKGPAVFRDLDQIDIDEGYDNDVHAFNSKTINERRVFNNRIAQSRSRQAASASNTGRPRSSASTSTRPSSRTRRC